MKFLLIGFLVCLGTITQAQTPDTVIILNEKDFYQPIVKFNFNQPLFILNGKKFSYDSLEVLNPNSIESINIIKGLEAREKYGDDGKNGVVIIKLKEVAKKEED